ncbi:putative nuclease HARBI1 [Heptranchias perlo]|uniref:putative nuclease HARBI1 n=1 Tax=Heptranchias perlo TaxID=212740 RepID=UPI003559EBAE
METFRDQFSYLNMSEDQCIRWLRFTKEVVTEICKLLQPQLQPQSGTRTALPVAVKVTVALNIYGFGSFQSSAGDLCNISQFAVHCCIREVTEALYELHNRFTTFPLDRKQQNEQVRGFARISGFPMVQAGVRPHIAHQVPVNARYHGSTHDAFIMWQSNVPIIFQLAWQVKGWLLGDKGYPLMRWLMTPVRNAHTRAEQAYSESHAATCNIIKRSVGVLKQCSRCLNHSGGALQYSAERVSRFLIVCWMLHNLALIRG